MLRFEHISFLSQSGLLFICNQDRLHRTDRMSLSEGYLSWLDIRRDVVAIASPMSSVYFTLML